MHDEIMIKFKKSKQSELLNKAIIKAGSQRALAKILKTPRRTLRNYFSERSLVPLPLLKKLLSFLAISINSIEPYIEAKLKRNWGCKKGGRNSISKLDNKNILNKMEYVRCFKKNIMKNQEFEMNAHFYEFYGILMGDGCISKYIDYQKNNRCDIFISGDKRYEMNYYQYIKQLLKDNFDVNSYLYEYRNNNSVRLVIRCKPFSDFLIRLGFPCGRKYNNLHIPRKMLNVDWSILKFLIRGLFDTDGTIFAKKNEGYKYPYIGISSKNRKLLSSLKQTLRQNGYPFYINNQNLFMKGIKNVKRWMADVGSSNHKHIVKYQYWLANKKLPSKLLGR